MDSLIVLATDALGGAERVLKLVATTICASRERVDVVFMSGPRRETWHGLPPNVVLHYIDAARERAGAIPVARLIARLSNERNYEEAFGTHTHINAWLGVLRHFGLLRTRRLIVRESTMVRRRFSGLRLIAIRSLYYLGYHQADLVVCQTQAMASELRLLVPRAKYWNMRVVPNPVALGLARERSTEAADPPPSSLGAYVVTAGRLIAVKGVDVLIEAFADLNDRHGGLKLLILGDGPLRESLESVARRRGIADRVVFLGRVSNPFPYLAGAEVGVVSSRVEGFPNVLLEMMCVCKRVVSTRCAGGIDEIDGLRSCPPDDRAALAGALEGAFSEEPFAHEADFLRELERRKPERYLDALLRE